MSAAGTRAVLAWLALVCGLPADAALWRGRPSWAWSRIDMQGPRPAAREGHAAVEVGQRVYILGGCVQETRCYRDIWILDIDHDHFRWLQEPFAGTWPEPRGGHSASLVGTDVYVYGGANSQDTFGDLFKLDLIKRRWSAALPVNQGDPTPGRRTNHAAVADADGRIYIFGGYDFRGAFLNDFWVLNTAGSSSATLDAQATFEPRWAAPLATGIRPAPRVGHTFNIMGRALILFGGYSAKGEVLNDLHMFDLDSLDWRELTPAGTLPLPRQGHSAVRHGRELVIAGGCDISEGHPGCFSDTWSFSFLDMRWTPRSNDSVTWFSREGHSATFVRGTMLAFGGCMLGAECYNDITVLNTFDPCPSDCGGNGKCSSGLEGAFCRCTSLSFAGHDCMQPAACRTNCGDHGQCSEDGRCMCENGWVGDDCSRELPCPGHPMKCAGHGVCLNSGICHCLPGFSGHDCGSTMAFLQAMGAHPPANVATEASMHARISSMFTRLLSAVGFGPSRHEGGHVDRATSDANAARSGPVPATLASAPGALGISAVAHASHGAACSGQCNNGVCQAGVCFCQPGFFGVACDVTKAQHNNTVGLTNVLIIAGVCAFLSAAVTLYISIKFYTPKQTLFRFGKT